MYRDFRPAADGARVPTPGGRGRPATGEPPGAPGRS